MKIKLLTQALYKLVAQHSVGAQDQYPYWPRTDKRVRMSLLELLVVRATPSSMRLLVGLRKDCASLLLKG